MLTGIHCTPMVNARLAINVGTMPMPRISAIARGDAKPRARSVGGKSTRSTPAPISKP